MDIHIYIFYQGAPIGALCVLDMTPRDLKPAQRSALVALARQVEGQLELRLNNEVYS